MTSVSMTTVSVALQQGVYEALLGDAALCGLLGGARIYDGAPRNAPLPFVTIDGITARDWSSGDGAGLEHVLTLGVWSRHGGKREIHAVLDAVRERLHQAALDIPGATLINLRFETSSAGQEDDGETWRGIIRFRAVTALNGE